MDKKGTHTIQSMLDVMTMTEEEELMAADIKGHVFELASVFLSLYITNRINKPRTSYRKHYCLLRIAGRNSLSKKASDD